MTSKPSATEIQVTHAASREQKMARISVVSACLVILSHRIHYCQEVGFYTHGNVWTLQRMEESPWLIQMQKKTQSPCGSTISLQGMPVLPWEASLFNSHSAFSDSGSILSSCHSTPSHAYTKWYCSETSSSPPFQNTQPQVKGMDKKH